MRKININVNDYTFEFICNSRDTRNGFAHDCNLFINNINTTEAHCYYINRTWEAWTFQSVCMEALYYEIHNYTEQKKAIYCKEHNYKRMTQKRTNDFENLMNEDNYYKILLECKDKLSYSLH